MGDRSPTSNEVKVDEESVVVAVTALPVMSRASTRALSKRLVRSKKTPASTESENLLEETPAKQGKIKKVARKAKGMTPSENGELPPKPVIWRRAATEPHFSEAQGCAANTNKAANRVLELLRMDAGTSEKVMQEVAAELEAIVADTWSLAIMLEANRAVTEDRAAIEMAAAATAPTGREQPWGVVTRKATKPTSGDQGWPAIPTPAAARPGVFFFPIGEAVDSPATKEAVKKAIVPAALKVQITGLRMVRGGGVIIHPRTEEEAKRLVNAPGLKEAGLRAEVAGKRLPRVIIFNIPVATTEAELRDAIIASTQEAVNPEVLNTIRLSHKAGPRTGKCHFVLYVPAKIREALINDGRLYMGWESFPVKDFCGVVKCTRCHLYGHMAKQCTAKTAVCGHCAIEGHDRAECPNGRAPAKCPACARHKKPHHHAATDPDCPARQYAVTQERNRTDYSTK